jgi:phosphate starvation-inducible PhoH-like protein
MKRKRQRRPATTAEPLREVAVTPLNRQQDAAIKAIERGTIVFLVGPAGTGKTHLACGWAVKAVADGRVERIVVTRPVVEAGESLGYLPGTYSDKVAPYLAPIYDAIDKLAGRAGRRRDQLNAATKIAPLAFMRGLTFENAVVLVDEAQNCTLQQLRLVISRLGNGSKMILTGDLTQSDLVLREQALKTVVTKLSAVAGVEVFKFEAAGIVRHPILQQVLAKLG